MSGYPECPEHGAFALGAKRRFTGNPCTCPEVPWPHFHCSCFCRRHWNMPHTHLLNPERLNAPQDGSMMTASGNRGDRAMSDLDENEKWGQFYVYMAEPGYVAIRCPCGVWDQFPHFEGKTDLKNLTLWARDHRERYGRLSSDLKSHVPAEGGSRDH